MKYALLVNTCDKFEDCWIPFFSLLKKYWPDCSSKIYLNTEYKSYVDGEISIESICGCITKQIPVKKRATWSQCLRWALEKIDYDIILYMQEDYFIKSRVDNNCVNYFVDLMKNNSGIDCIQLTPGAVKHKGKSKYEKLDVVDNTYWSTISCQASLWRRDVLLKYIRDYESAWQFEWWGSKRAKILNDNFFVVSDSWVVSGKYEIIPYIITGVIGGAWYKPVVELFNNNNLHVDYSQRGFFEENKSITWFEKQKRRFFQLPVEVRNLWNLFWLKRKI